MIEVNDEIRTPVQGEELELNFEEVKTAVRTNSPEGMSLATTCQIR